jgi:AraC-like DNA-binding protein
MNYEDWQQNVRTICGRYTAGGVEPCGFSGDVGRRSIYGLNVVNLSCSALRLERTQRDARLDQRDHYYAVFHIAGRSRIVQDERMAELGVGDVLLLDAARPITYLTAKTDNRWGALQVPRRQLLSHLGREPRCLESHAAAPAARHFLRLLQDGIHDVQPMPAAAEAYMGLALLDILGALFAPEDSSQTSRHSDRLFARLCAIIRERFSDPGFGPAELSTAAGLSLRYIQKIFTGRNTTCSRFIAAVRLDHAASLLERRSLLKTSQPISEIAYMSGFGDYTHFNRCFRSRFGHPPGQHQQDGRRSPRLSETADVADV